MSIFRRKSKRTTPETMSESVLGQVLGRGRPAEAAPVVPASSAPSTAVPEPAAPDASAELHAVTETDAAAGEAVGATEAEAPVAGESDPIAQPGELDAEAAEQAPGDVAASAHSHVAPPAHSDAVLLETVTVELPADVSTFEPVLESVRDSVTEPAAESAEAAEPAEDEWSPEHTEVLPWVIEEPVFRDSDVEAAHEGEPTSRPDETAPHATSDPVPPGTVWNAFGPPTPVAPTEHDEQPTEKPAVPLADVPRPVDAERSDPAQSHASDGAEAVGAPVTAWDQASGPASDQGDVASASDSDDHNAKETSEDGQTGDTSEDSADAASGQETAAHVDHGLPSHGIGHLAHVDHGTGTPRSGLGVSVDEHLARVLAGVPELPAYPQPLMDTLGAAAAEEIRAEVALPGFDNSAMDGYAVRAADCAEATPEAPVVLPVVGENIAGRTGLLAMSPGTAVKVMTGAPVPNGADAVVPYEWTDRGVARVQIQRGPEAGVNIRRAGEDVQVGDLVLRRGAVIGPRQLGLLAGVGRATVRTRPRPRVVILSTGSELREVGQPVGGDAIHDANSYLLAAAVRAAGAIAYRVGIVPDQPRAFRQALSDQLVRADLVITSGGVSEGDHDVVKAALRDGAGSSHDGSDTRGDVWFGPVAMQPGRPQGFGVIGEDATPIFTLPGNPVSAYVSFHTFVLPALRKMMGMTPHVRPTQRATLGVPLTKAPGKRQFVRGLHEIDRGRPLVTPVGGHGSHLLGDLAAANCLIVLGENTTSAAVGDQVDVLLFDETE